MSYTAASGNRRYISVA
ncbi:hypothetical protein [Streptococcus salivarius]